MKIKTSREGSAYDGYWHKEFLKDRDCALCEGNSLNGPKQYAEAFAKVRFLDDCEACFGWGNFVGKL